MPMFLKRGAAGWRSPKTNKMPSMVISRLFDDDDAYTRFCTNEFARRMNDSKKETDEWPLT